MIVKEQINEEVLCLLRKDKAANQIVIDYITIENSLAQTINSFSLLCDDEKSTLTQIGNFIRINKGLDSLTNYYRYCKNLSGSYQAFSANNQQVRTEIKNKQQLILSKYKSNPKNYDIKEAISDYKYELKSKYLLWGKAFSINKAYRLCHEDKSVLTFSHRMDGWSNPLYQLTPNFSLEIKSNFGYGRASYFYTKLKYKDLDITPYSEWINYEYALFSEIVRYTQSHLLKNEYWLEAMEFSRDACNLSMTNETQFLEKYVIDECEIMVTGLEDIFNKDHFSFDSRDKNKYTKDKKGHELVEFRGEKISGSLDFISSILQFEKIASIRSYIKRIENCNKRIQPILKEESKIIKIKLRNLEQERDELTPKYKAVLREKNRFIDRINVIQTIMIKNGYLQIHSIDREKLNAEFHKQYPSYIEFSKRHEIITESYKAVTEKIENHTNVLEKITSYDHKILQYFSE